MKKTSDDLYNLIRSLNKSEKSYFKKYSRMYSLGDTAYIKLFNAVEKQAKSGKGYDEAAIRKSLKNENSVNQFPSAKNFLYNLLLKISAAYNQTETDNSRLYDMNCAIQMLYNKTLFSQAEKLLFRAKKLAYETGNFQKLYELLQWEKNLLQENPSDNQYKRFEEIYEEEKLSLKILAEASEIKNIYGLAASILHYSGYARTTKGVTEFRKLMNRPIMRSADALKTFNNKTFYYDTYIEYYAYVRDFENHYRCINENVKLYEANPEQIKKRLNDYAVLIHNQMSGCLYLKRFNEYRKTFEKYMKFKSSIKKMNTGYLQVIDLLIRKHELIYFNTRGEFDKGMKFIDSYIIDINEIRDKIDSRELNLIYYFCSLILFGAGKYKESLSYANKIINSGEPDQRKEIYLSARVMSIIIHYELNNTDYLDSHVRSIYRYLLSRKIEYKFERFLIGFFRKILNKITRKELLLLFEESRKKISKLMEDPYEVSGMLYFDYTKWLESKINNKSFKELVKENINAADTAKSEKD